MGAVKHDLEHPDIIIFGTKDAQRTTALDMLALMHADMSGYGWLSGKVHAGTWEEAESIKIFYNTFISTKLGLVNMMQDVAQRIGNMDVDVVTRALQASTQRITGPKYMTAGLGDGGPCHPRDNIALRWLANELDLGYDLFTAIMSAREQQAMNMAKFVVNVATNKNQEIYIHGKSFKPAVPYCDGSYSLLLGNCIKELGHAVTYIDPCEDKMPDAVLGIILLAHDPSVTYNYVAAHERQQYCRFLPGSTIIDPWRKYETDDQNIEVIHYGNTRRPA